MTDKDGRPILIVEPDNLGELFTALQQRGFTLIGPTVQNGAIVYDQIESSADLPAGWDDQQDNGHYRLVRRDDEALFAYVVGPNSWKTFLHPPRQRLITVQRSGEGFSIQEEKPAVPHYALIGARPCELAAIEILDHVFTGGPYTDLYYQARRQDNFILAVNCAEPGGTCFCTSMGTGPQVQQHFDLAFTELLDPIHLLLTEIGSDLGAEVMAEVTHRPATSSEIEAAAAISAAAEKSMGRQLATEGLQEGLYEAYAHPRWEEIATRCLSCANCTMVCPTCFCSTIEDVTDLAGEVAERSRVSDSCFTNEFTYIHGGSLRDTTCVRYRQWLTHKLATWVDQFGTFGCVGCGRCITWCPVGIDITAEAAHLVEDSASRHKLELAPSP